MTRFSKKTLRLSGLILGALFATYFIATAIFLNCGLLTRILNENPESVKMEYRFAFSLFPGKVHLYGVRFRLQDSNIQMEFQLARAYVTLQLTELFSRRFHFTEVDGSGLVFRFRFKRQAEALENLKAGALPPIAGLESLLKTPDPNPGPPKNAWQVFLEGVDIANVSEIWFEEFRFNGLAKVKGGFFLNPGRRVRVLPALVAVEQGSVSIGETEALNALTGRIEATIHEFDPEQIPGLELFSYVEAKVGLSARLENVEFANYYFKEAPWLKLSEGAGEGDLQLAINRGKFIAPSHFRVASEKLQIQFWDQRATGKGKVEWRTTAPEGNSLDVELDQFRLFHKDHREFPIEGARLQLAAKSKTNEISKTLEELDLEIGIPDASFTDLSYLNTYLPRRSKLAFTGGRANADISLHSSTKKAGSDYGNIRISGENAGFKYDGFSFVGSIKVEAKLEDSNIAEGDVRSPQTTLRLSKVSFGKEGEDKDEDLVRNWWANASFTKLRFRAEPSPEVASQIQLQSASGRPFVAFLSEAANASLPGWLQSLLSFDNLNLHLKAVVGSEHLVLENLVAEGEHTKLLGWLSEQRDSRQGRLLLQYGPFAAGLKLENENTRVRLHDAISWYRQEPHGMPASPILMGERR